MSRINIDQLRNIRQTKWKTKQLWMTSIKARKQDRVTTLQDHRTDKEKKEHLKCRFGPISYASDHYTTVAPQAKILQYKWKRVLKNTFLITVNSKKKNLGLAKCHLLTIYWLSEFIPWLFPTFPDIPRLFLKMTNFPWPLLTVSTLCYWSELPQLFDAA